MSSSVPVTARSTAMPSPSGMSSNAATRIPLLIVFPLVPGVCVHQFAPPSVESSRGRVAVKLTSDAGVAVVVTLGPDAHLVVQRNRVGDEAMRNRLYLTPILTFVLFEDAARAESAQVVQPLRLADMLGHRLVYDRPCPHLDPVGTLRVPDPNGAVDREIGEVRE